MHTRLPIATATILLALLASSPTARAQTVSHNDGSLGLSGDGTYVGSVTHELPGPLGAGNDFSVGYSAGSRTTVPYNAALNPPASSPFSVEFWAYPTASDGDDSPLANRIASGNRSGWVFFQRTAATGWNFRMYNGNGSALGWDLTGGTSTLNAWSHVVATWNGSAALLYVNGTLADNTNDAAANGVYNPNTASTAAIFSSGALFDGGSPSTGRVDEVAYYPSLLTPAQIMDHYVNALLNPVPGAYASTVIGDGALEYLRNNPESPPLAGDINRDGQVTRQDAAQFAHHFGLAVGSDWETGDFNNDGATNLTDLALMQANLTPTGGSPAFASAVPEPSAFVLFLGAAAILIVASHKRRGV